MGSGLPRDTADMLGGSHWAALHILWDAHPSCTGAAEHITQNLRPLGLPSTALSIVLD